MSYILINPIARLEGATWTAEIGFTNKLCPHVQQKATVGTSHKAWVVCRPSDTQISAGKKVLELGCLFIIFFYLYEQMYIYIYMHLHACMCIYTHTISCNYINMVISYTEMGICMALSSSYFMFASLLSPPKDLPYQ